MRSKIAMIDGYEVQRHLSAETVVPPSSEDIQQDRFDEAKARLQALVPINDALYDALGWYRTKALALTLNPITGPFTLLVGAFPVERFEGEVDQWHTMALKLMENDSYLYDVAADDARWIEFSNFMDKQVKYAADVANRIEHDGLLSATSDFFARFPKALKETIKYAVDGSGKLLREGFGIDLKALRPWIIGGVAILALIKLAPMLSSRRSRS